MSSSTNAFIIAVTLAAAATSEARPATDAAPTNEPAKKEPVTSGRGEKVKAIDPQAMAAVDRMGAFLRDQKNFSVRTTTQTDYLLDNGQKVRLEAQGDLQVERPNRLRADTMSDRKDRQFYYDGKTFTIYSPRIGYYSTVRAPGTINELADQLENQYGLELPLVDLFRIGTDENALNDVTSARYVGKAKVDGVDTDLYAFRQPGVDWQIWIQEGDQPVPRKLVLTTTDDPARPERSIDMTWNLGATHEPSVFAFVPPKGSAKIAMADVNAQRQQTEKARRSTRSAHR